MMNQVILVGRLTRNPEKVELEDGKSVMTMPLAVSRSFKNIDGEYETDFINCILWNQIAETTAEYCKIGDVIALKGILQTRSYEDKDNNKKYTMEVVAEKVTFLSTNRAAHRESDKETSFEER